MRDTLPAVLLATLPFIGLFSGAVADCGVRNNALKFSRKITVDRHGRGHYSSIQAAVNSVPSGNNLWVRIIVNPGIYTEKLTIPRDKPCVFLDGQNRHLATITFNGHDYTDTSATFSSFPDNVVVRGITFKNSYNVYGTKTATHVKQALAARVYGDKSVFFECGFVGVQDTLWDAMGRHYYHSCYVEGAVDFIFGGGQSYFEDCMINATVSLPPHHITKGYVTAQGRKSHGDSSGFVFRRGAVVGAQNVFLGRAYGPYSRVIFHETLLSAGVAPEGWDAWWYKGHETRITYAEVGCKGRGSNKTSRVRWTKQFNQVHMDKFSRSAFIDHEGWLASHPVSNKIKNYTIARAALPQAGKFYARRNNTGRQTSTNRSLLAEDPSALTTLPCFCFLFYFLLPYFNRMIATCFCFCFCFCCCCFPNIDSYTTNVNSSVSFSSTS